MFKTLIIFVIFAYLFFAMIAYFFADKIIFPAPRSSYQDTVNILKLKTKDGAVISAVYLPNKNSKYVMLFSHGNAEDLGDMLPFLRDIVAQGFSVFSYDYHGYGTSSGKPTEQHVYEDINAAYDYLINTLNIPPKHIIVFGRSIGAAVAIDLAVRQPVAGLIVQSGFVTAFRVLTRVPLLPFDKFNNLNKIAQVSCPALIIHGTKDTIVPFWHGKKLFETVQTPKQHLWIKGADHNDPIWEIDPHYWDVIRGFVGKIGG